jgi:hypothetical protein
MLPKELLRRIFYTIIFYTDPGGQSSLQIGTRIRSPDPLLKVVSSRDRSVPGP